MSATYCVLLPVDTPLFVHVRRALDCFLPRCYAGRIQPRVFSGGALPNDNRLAQYLASHVTWEDGETIVAGICDPCSAREQNLKVYAGIVKRLAFAILTPNSFADRLREPASITIYAHGAGSTTNSRDFVASSSAEAFARFIGWHFGKPEETVISTFDYKEIPELKGDAWILITANLPAACQTFARNQSHCIIYEATALFPEWSRLLLSALVPPYSALDNQRTHEALDAVVLAVHQACLDIRFCGDDTFLSELLLEYYKDDITTVAVAKHVSRLLQTNRYVPSDVEPSRHGVILATALWQPNRRSNVLFKPRQRFQTPPNQNQKLGGVRIPTIERTTARKTRPLALRVAFDANTQARSIARLNTDSVDILILTATRDEYEAVKAQFRGQTEQLRLRAGSSVFECIVRFTEQHFYVVIACMNGMGRVQAALASMQLVPRWRPEILVLAGIAGGVEKNGVKRGDVIIVQKAIDYELQKLEEEKACPYYDQIDFDPGLVAHAVRIGDDTNGQKWLTRLGGTAHPEGPGYSPVCHKEANKYLVLSGDKVFADKEALTKHLRAYPRAIGVEMEAAGVGAALRLCAPKPPFVMIRAISDLADEGKATNATPGQKANQEAWRNYACHVAAAFTAEFVHQFKETAFF